MTEERKKRLALILVLAVLITGGSFYFYQQKSSVSETTAVMPAPPNSVATPKTDAGEIIVYISGAVNKPGVLSVPAGSRVVDVVNAAGGLAPGADPAKVNMAKVLKDGMQVNVPGVTTPARSGSVSTSRTGSTTVSSSSGYDGEKISINFASKAELDKLPGIGPAMAEQIVDYRQHNGTFRDISELKKVPGIGEVKFNVLKDKISL